MFEIRWSISASESYTKEADFVYDKWGVKGVKKFLDIVDDFLKLLASGVLVGKPSKKRDIRITVISKQTSLAYKVDEKNKIIHLVLFWNNKTNPEKYSEYLDM